MDKTQKNILNIYWGLINNLSNKWKLDLIEKLSKSIRENMDTSQNNIEKSFGQWEGEESAEELITNIKNSRSTNREIEAF